MHEGVHSDDCVLLPACRCRKLHTSRRDAFQPINDEPYARIRSPGLAIERLREYPAHEQGAFRLRLFDEKLKVGLVATHPQFYAEELRAYEEFDGLVIEILGIGNMPTMQTDEHNAENKRIYEELCRLCARMPVAGAPRTIGGRINLAVYSPGRQLLDAGMLGHLLDMTPDAAFVKLAWLLSNFPRKDIPRLYHEDLRGEISQRSVF